MNYEKLTIDDKRCEYLERLPRTELEREVNESLLENCKETQENIRRQRESAMGQSAFFNAKGSLQEEQRAQQQRHCTATQYIRDERRKLNLFKTFLSTCICIFFFTMGYLFNH